MVTHAVRYALKYADRVAFLSDGTFVELHAAERFVSDAKSEVVQKYLGDAGLFA
jgi:ABC-type polar amino acid transport system ATPase subunit